MSAEPVRCLTDQDVPMPAAILDSIHLRRHLQRILPSHWGPLQDIQIQVVRNHPGKRCTVEVSLRTTTGWRHLIGKIYAKDRSDIYQTMDGLRQLGFEPDAEFSIPEPLAYEPSLRLLLYEKAQGARVDKVFLSGNEHERRIAAHRCAQWLARFQGLAPRPRRVLNLTDHLISMERWSRLIAEGCEPLAVKAGHLFKQLKFVSGAIVTDEMCASHGDFSTRNIIFSEDCAVVYDWDGCRLANPCRDVASFIVDLSRLALHRLGSIRELDAPAKEFQRTYSAMGRSEVLSYLPFYKAARCLEVANIIFRKQKPRWRENVEAMLDEGFCALKE